MLEVSCERRIGRNVGAREHFAGIMLQKLRKTINALIKKVIPAFEINHFLNMSHCQREVIFNSKHTEK
jgi:hypothetical protein